LQTAAFAQAPYDQPKHSRPVPQTRMSDSQYLIFQRAQARARMRVQRLELWKSIGHSPQRPSVIAISPSYKMNYYDSPFHSPTWLFRQW
jgi:hypothetical protein